MVSSTQKSPTCASYFLLTEYMSQYMGVSRIVGRVGCVASTAFSSSSLRTLRPLMRAFDHFIIWFFVSSVFRSLTFTCSSSTVFFSSSFVTRPTRSMYSARCAPCWWARGAG